MYINFTFPLTIMILCTMCLSLDAQNISKKASNQAYEDHCKTIVDVVDRERCNAEAGIDYLLNQIKARQLSGTALTEVEAQISRQKERIARLDKMSPAERKRMQMHYDSAKAARSSR